LNLTDSSCILFYNPYSIVKELPIAKTGAELIASMDSPLILAVTFCGVDGRQSMKRNGHSGSAVRPLAEAGGADRDRTDDPLLAKQVLSQLSYSPSRFTRG
jgi:hypothetical protein